MTERLTDLANTPYQSPDGRTAQNGVPVQISTPNGPQPGTMIGGYVVPQSKT